MLLRHLLLPLLMFGAHVLHVLLNLRLLLGCQNPEDLIAQLTRRSVNALRTGGMSLGVLIEQALNLGVLLIRKVHAVENPRPAPIDLRRRLRPGGALLIPRRRSLLRANGDGK